MKPKIYECLAKDELRPTMCHALITKEDIVASDAHVLVWHKTKDFFDEDFIKVLPKKGILVSKPALYDISLKSTDHVRYFESVDKKVRMIIVKHTNEDERYFKVHLNDNESMMKYPAFKKVWPKLTDAKPVQTIGINPIYAMKLSKGIGSETLEFEFYGSDKAIVIKNHRGDFQDSKGLIMPVMFP